MSRIGIATLTLTTATLAASGCGGSKSSAGAQGLTRSQLVSRADAICSRAVAARASLKYRSPQGLGRVLVRLASYDQTARAELGRLTAPASMADDWRKIVAGLHTLAQDNAKVGEYVKFHNIAAARRLYVTVIKIRQEIRATAAHDGFKDCVQID